MNEKYFLCGWQHESYKLTRGTEPVFGKESISLSCCRNDWAAASIVLRPVETSVVLIENRSDFCPNKNYPVIRAEVRCPDLPDCTLFRVKMHPDDDRVEKGDALLDYGREIVKSWVPMQLFLRVNVPADAKPGIYKGEVRLYVHYMFEDEEMAQALPFTIEVADVVLPSGKDRKFNLTIWQHPTNIARQHGVPLFSEEHFALLEEYTRTLSELGNVTATVAVGDIPWAGQFCYFKTDPYSDLFEYNMVRITRDEAGEFHYDYSVLDRYLKLCKKYDMVREIYLFGLIRNWDDKYQDVRRGFGNITEDYPDAIRLRYIDEKDGCGKYMKKAAEIKAYIASLAEWLRQEGWLTYSLIAADEPPDMDEYNKAMAVLNEVVPELRKQLDIPPSWIVKHPELELDSYTPGIYDIAQSEKESPGSTRKALERCTGITTWSTCCWPLTPNTFLRSPLLEGRFHGILAEWLKVNGFLRWAYTCWPVDPMNDPATMEWPSGDAFLVYPGKNGRTIFTLRYFALKRGIGDFELMQMVKAECPNGEALVDEALKPIFRQPDVTKWNFYQADDSQYSFDPEEYEALRKTLVDALLQERNSKKE